MATKRSLGRARDAGLRRIRAITGWTVAGALAGTGLFAGLAAHSAPVSTAGAKKARVTGTTSGRRSPVATSTQIAPTQPPPVLPASLGAMTPLVSGAS
jgi:hypothetical protein